MYKLQLKDNPQRSLWLVGDKIRLGTGLDNEWVLDGLGINEHHAQILIDLGILTLECLSGDCYINDQSVRERCILNSKDELRIGQHRLIILDSQQIEEQKRSAKKIPTNDTVAKKTNLTWSIVANHPRLKDRKFLISSSATLGRDKECDFVIPYRLLSREHARFEIDNHELLLTDLDSSNGVFVNGKRIKEVRLKGSETITFAKLSFVVKSPYEATSHLEEPVNSNGEMNKTMIRPVVNMDIALEYAQHDSDSANSKLTRGIDEEPSPVEAIESATNTNRHGGHWFIVAAILLGAAIGCWSLGLYIK